MAQRVISNDLGEIFGRNQAIQRLKIRLKENGIRVNLASVFEKRQSFELLSLYFKPVDADGGSQKYLCTPKSDFHELVKDESLLDGYALLLPKPPEVIEIPISLLRDREAETPTMGTSACATA
jgi:hypothetical protein